MRQTDRHLAGLLAFFVCAWVVCAWVFGYVAFLQSRSADSFFMFGSQFLREWLAHPGDLTLYADRFLLQFSHVGWLGALITSALATGLGFLAHRIAVRLRPEPGLLSALLPALAVLALHTGGTNVAIGAIVQYCAFLGYLRLAGAASRRAYIVVATVLLYFLTGAYVWPFVLWVLVRESRGRPVLTSLGYGTAYLLLAVCLPLASYRWLYSISLAVAFRHPVYTSGATLDLALYAYLALLPLGLGLSLPRILPAHLARGRSLALQGAVTAVLAALLLSATYDRSSAELARYHRLYEARQWDAILEAAGDDTAPSGIVQFFTNCALAGKGRLLEEMFSYPQTRGTNGLLLSASTQDADLGMAMYASDVLFEMGHTNAAYRLAYNQLNLGRSYANLRRLAECTIANGSYEIAAKYLHLLDRTLFHRDFARRYLGLLSDPASADTCLADVRRQRPRLEFQLNLGNFAWLLALAEANPDNRMALDYLMAWCLLDKNALPVMAAALPRLAKAGYTSIPIHCQEGLLLRDQLAGAPADRPTPGIDAATRGRFADFGRQVRQYPDRESAQLGLREDFGHTYMYYYAAVEPAGPRTQPWSWVRLGNEYRAMGRVDEAIAFYRQALRTPPRYGAAHVYLAETLLAQGKPAEAAAHFQQVLQVDPATQQAHVRLDQAWTLGTH